MLSTGPQDRASRRHTDCPFRLAPGHEEITLVHVLEINHV
jgi:hypothetical protein